MKKLTSRIDLIEEFRKNAPNFFEVSENQLTQGLFPHLTLSSAKITEYAMTYANMLSKEFFTATAMKRETLLLEGSYYGLTEVNAKPAEMTVNIGIPLNELIENSERTTDGYRFTISKDSVVHMEDFEFMPEFDIIINGKVPFGSDDPDKITWSANHVLDGETPNSLAVEFVPTSSIHLEGIDYITVLTTTRQVTKTFTEYSVVDSGIRLSNIEFPYDGDLAYFIVRYKGPNSDNFRTIPHIHYMSKQIPHSDVYVKYNDNDPEELVLGIYGEAEYNSELLVEIFTTRGEEGNLQTSNAETTITLSKYDDSIDYSSISPICFPVTDSTKGRNEMTLEELRNEVIYLKATTDVLLTPNDLKLHFERLNRIDNVEYLERRSDVEERAYSGFLLPRLSDGSIAPTMTANVLVKLDSFDVIDYDQDIFVLKPNRFLSRLSAMQNRHYGPDEIIYIQEQEALRNAMAPNDSNNIQIDQLANDISTLLANCPYTLRVHRDTRLVEVFNSNVNHQALPLVTEFWNSEIRYHFMVSRLSIVREPLAPKPNVYTIKFSAKPMFDIPDELIDPDSPNGLTSDDIIIAKVSAYDITGNEMEGYVDAHLEMYDHHNDVFHFSAEFETDDVYTSNDSLYITNMRYPSSEILENIDIRVPIPTTDLKLGVHMFIKADGPRVPYEFGRMDGYVLTGSFSNKNDTISIYERSNLIRCNVRYLPLLDSFIINDVPLVKSTILYHHGEDFITSINRAYEASRLTNEKTINNFTTLMSFFRTYGPSDRFKLNAFSNNPLDLTSLDLKLRAKIHRKPINESIEETIDAIKLDIRRIFESQNTSSEVGNSNTIFFSNIASEIERLHESRIYSFEIMSLNDMYDICGHPIRTSTLTYDIPDFRQMSEEEFRGYVHEFINMSLENITIEVKQY